MLGLGPAPSAPAVGATTRLLVLVVEHHAALPRERQVLLGDWREAIPSSLNMALTNWLNFFFFVFQMVDGISFIL